MQNQNKKAALLVSVNISQWTGRKTDKRARQTVADAHHVELDAINPTKKLLPGSKELARISTVTGQIRELVHRETLPWMSDGTRILASQNYLDFAQKFRAKKSQFESAVADFLRVYPTLIESAKAKLGDLYRESDYKSVGAISRAFKCEMTIFPLPESSDFRIDISELERQAFESKLLETQRQAIGDCWKRLHDVVQTAAQKLNDPNAKFQESLISNIVDICDLLPKLDYTNDPALQAERIKVRDLASRLSPGLLRVNALERDAAAKKLSEIQNAMSVFMGA